MTGQHSGVIHRNGESELLEKEEMEVTKELVRGLLEELTPFERFLISLKYKEELPNKKVAELLDVTQNYAGVILFNLRKKIKESIWEVLEGLTPFEHFIACLKLCENVSNKKLANIIGETETHACTILCNLREKITKMILESKRRLEKAFS